MWMPPQRFRNRVHAVIKVRREVMYESGDGQDGSMGRSWSGPMVV